MPPVVAAEYGRPAVIGVLSSLRRKLRALSVLYGLGLVVACTVGVLVVAVLADYLLDLPAGPRAVLLLVCAGVVGWTVWVQLIRAMLRHLTLSDLAGRLELAFPQFGDRLRSSIDFLRQDVPGSAFMKQAVVGEAQALAAQTDLNQALIIRPVLCSLTGGIVAIGLLCLLAVTQGQLARIAMYRLMLRPGADWPRKAQISLVGSLPAKVAAGQRLEVRMRLVKGDRPTVRPVLYCRYDSGRLQEQLMSRGADGSYSAAVDARGNSMSLWIKAWDDRTEPQTIQVVQRLGVRSVSLRADPPPYARMEPLRFSLADGPALVTAGSALELSVEFSKALAADRPVVIEPVGSDSSLPQVEWVRSGPSQVSARWVAGQSLRFRIRGWDADGFENPALEEYQILVRPDQNPSVILENPTRNEDRTAVAVVKLVALAEDDFDISSMTLVVDRKADNRHWELPLSGWQPVEGLGQRRRFRVRYDWELSQLESANLMPGDVLEYRVRVTDNYDLNGRKHEPAESGALRIQIISQETLELQVAESMRALAQRIRQTQNAQNRNLQETSSLRQDVASKERMDSGDRAALSRISDQQGALASQTRQLAGRMSELQQRLEENRSTSQDLSNTASEVRSVLSEAAEQPMSDALRRLAETAEHVSAAMDDQQRKQRQVESLQASENAQQQASEQLGKALARMGNLGVFEHLLQEVRSALNRQQDLSRQLAELGNRTLGKRVEQLTEDQRKQLETIAEAQRKESERTQKLASELAKAAEELQKSDPGTSEAMRQASQQAHQQQVSSNQMQAAQNAQQNQQSQAQARQRMAEIGLQMMLDTLRSAERRKLEQLSRELARLQELLANLVRRQAGHNIDNLRIQDTADALKQITEELLSRAERVRDQMPPKPSLAQLGSSQELTERNTRDVSRTAEDLPRGGAEIAGVLTRAASFMERAVVSIRQGQLPEAYDPPQIQALALLQEAVQKTDAAAADIQRELEQADRETLRQAYEKIRAEQEKINAETAEIDSTGRLPDGTLKREQAVRLGRLPGRQQELAEQIQSIEKDLRDLGSVVYVWANQDIAASMKAVRQDLSEQKTGPPTQAEERRIVEQLDAMIRSLAIRPRESEFHQPPGTGGGSRAGASARLPSEAELRLLKELQLAINKATRTLDSLPQKDQPRLQALGDRQGQLRGLLDQLLQTASRGQIKLDPEPDPKDRLPEEASTSEIENQEIEDWLRGARSSDDQLANDVKMAGQRMARSRQRLSLDHDPGKTTQRIQERIVMNLDNLIQLAQQQMVRMVLVPGQGRGQMAVRPQSTSPQAQNRGISQPNRGSSPAGSERLTPGGDNTARPSRDIRETAAEWGHLTPRQRQAVIEGTHDTIIPKYRRLTEDYYEAMSRKGSEQR